MSSAGKTSSSPEPVGRRVPGCRALTLAELGVGRTLFAGGGGGGGNSGLEKFLQMEGLEGLWQGDLRVQTEASVCGSRAWE